MSVISTPPFIRRTSLPNKGEGYAREKASQNELNEDFLREIGSGVRHFNKSTRSETKILLG